VGVDEIAMRDHFGGTRGVSFGDTRWGGWRCLLSSKLTIGKVVNVLGPSTPRLGTYPHYPFVWRDIVHARKGAGSGRKGDR
jgi:hypothetical protein